MIDAGKMTYKERWAMYFAFAAMRAIERDDNETGYLHSSGILDPNFKPYNPWVEDFDCKIPSYEQTKVMFEEVFGLNYDELWTIDNHQPWMIPAEEEEEA